MDGVYLKQAQLLDVDLREAGSNSRYFKVLLPLILTSFCTQVYTSAKSFKQVKNANLR